MQNKNVLNRIVNVCGKVVGERMVSMDKLYECRIVKKALNIQDDTTHALANSYVMLPSGRHFRAQRVSTVRARSSFVSMSIKLLNQQ